MTDKRSISCHLTKLSITENYDSLQFKSQNKNKNKKLNKKMVNDLQILRVLLQTDFLQRLQKIIIIYKAVR